MNTKPLKLLFIFTCFILLQNCGGAKDDDCTKEAKITNYYYVNNQSYSYESTIEIPCDFPDPEPVEIDIPILDNFTYEIISFIYTKDTGNNTSRLQFEIKLINNNDFAVEGVPVITMKTPELEFSSNYYASKSPNNCYKLDANSSCTLSYDEEASLDLGVSNSIEIINVEYYLTKKISS
ncbi:hypothetical protein [Aestuariibaculum sediminum]|uniref:Uncharacterized protein n=1 Tax=Aestuariibaculum sediminum TaxID=2770637 RepID=A0A8J6U9C8_9FLAO|nr:hypothetical protein [Aestuariibaculum sediminum]MBD0832967.1 hypothetical protein [Aestuariibaculum sediminum]